MNNLDNDCFEGERGFSITRYRWTSNEFNKRVDRDVLNTKDRIKNKKLVSHLKEKMFRGFIKFKQHSSAFKNYSDSTMGSVYKFRRNTPPYTDSNFHQSKTNLIEVSDIVSPFKIEKIKFSSSSHKNIRNDSASKTNCKSKKSVFLTDKVKENPTIENKLKSLYNLNSKKKAEDPDHSNRMLEKKIFQDSFEKNQYSHLNFVALDVGQTISYKKPNSITGKVFMENDILKQVENLNKMYYDGFGNIETQSESSNETAYCKGTQTVNIFKHQSLNYSAKTEKKLTEKKRPTNNLNQAPSSNFTSLYNTQTDYFPIFEDEKSMFKNTIKSETNNGTLKFNNSLLFSKFNKKNLTDRNFSKPKNVSKENQLNTITASKTANNFFQANVNFNTLLMNKKERFKKLKETAFEETKIKLIGGGTTYPTQAKKVATKFTSLRPGLLDKQKIDSKEIMAKHFKSRDYSIKKHLNRMFEKEDVEAVFNKK
jgi:hypothetical protein